MKTKLIIDQEYFVWALAYILQTENEQAKFRVIVGWVWSLIGVLYDFLTLVHFQLYIELRSAFQKWRMVA